MVATQTSVVHGGEPGRAIDGNTNGEYHAGKSCIHTGDEPKTQVWMLDMGKNYRIRQVCSEGYYY